MNDNPENDWMRLLTDEERSLLDSLYHRRPTRADALILAHSLAEARTPDHTPVPTAREQDRPVWIYIAGPYSSGPVQGVRNAILAGEAVYAAGAIPIVPHESMLWDLVSPHDAAFYYAYDLALLARCDALLRLPGASSGADAEVAEARRLKLPVIELPHPDADLIEATLSLVAMVRYDRPARHQKGAE